MTNIVELVNQNPNVASAIAAFLAAFAALISIILTVASLWIQRRHNFKTVTPIANILPSDYENDIAVRIRNSGTGPLIIRRLTVTQQGVPPAKNIISLMPDLPDGITWTTFFMNAENYAITPSNSITLIRLEDDDSNENFSKARDSVRYHLGKLKLTLEYQDIYGRSMPKNTKALDLFNR